MAHEQLWFEDVSLPGFPSLKKDIEAETVVIGAGITGIMTAYLLAKAGKKPVILEKNSVGAGETGYTTAFLTYYVDTSLLDLKRRLGRKRAALVWETGARMIEEIERIILEEDIECEFVHVPLHVFAASEADVAFLKKEAALGKELGYPVEFRASGLKFEPFGFLEIPNQAKFHLLKFIEGLVKKIVEYGGTIYTESPVTDFTGRNKNVLVTPHGNVTAHHVVVATHAPIDNAYETPTRMVGALSYVISGHLPPGTIPEGLYIDTNDPYHYIRVDAFDDHDRLIVGGEDHVCGRETDTEKHVRNLERYVKHLVGSVSFTRTHEWSGMVLKTPDTLPFIGPSAFNKHHFIATGFTGNGITFGAASAFINRDAIDGKVHPWASLYSPRRLTGVWRLMLGGWDVTREWVLGFSRTEHKDKTKLKPGEGHVISYEGKTLAVSCSASGTCTAVSAVCTHLGCHVQWNETEKTWDCPCHASRFTPKGDVINGPALKPLERFPDIEKRLGQK